MVAHWGAEAVQPAPQKHFTRDVAVQAGLEVDSLPDEAAFRERVAAAGIALGDPDLLYYFPAAERAAVEAEERGESVRRLTAADADAFAAFEQQCSAADIDVAYVELDHWAVFGSFEGDALAAVTSAYPWRDGPLADVGILTAPGFRGKGHGRRAVRAIAAHIWAEGYEPQYRTQPDNPASQALAVRAGMVYFGTWEGCADGS